MFDCNDDLVGFHNDEVTLREKERQAMRERRDANRTRLEKHLDDNEKPPVEMFIKQGSYAMRTMVQDPENDYDIDDGVYFTQASLRNSGGTDMAPLAARQLVCTALKDDRFNRQPEVRKNCVRIFYNEGYHVDVPVYRIRESDGEYELACGDSWVVSRAADVEEWFDDENTSQSPDEDNGRQLRRVTRLVKKFSRSRNNWKSKIAAGFTITKLVVDHYAADAERDDIALQKTMRAIHNRLEVSLEVEHPVTPGSMLTEGSNDSKTKFLREQLGDALKELEILDTLTCTRKKALTAWDNVFNTDYFASREATKALEGARVIAAPTVITRPAQPWVEK